MHKHKLFFNNIRNPTYLLVFIKPFDFLMNSIYEFLGHFDIPLHKSVYPQDKYGAADNHLALAFICVLL